MYHVYMYACMHACMRVTPPPPRLLAIDTSGTHDLSADHIAGSSGCGPRV